MAFILSFPIDLSITIIGIFTYPSPLKSHLLRMPFTDKFFFLMDTFKLFSYWILLPYIIMLIISICLKFSAHLTFRHTFSLLSSFLFRFYIYVAFTDPSFSSYLFNIYVLPSFCPWPIPFVLLSKLY